MVFSTVFLFSILLTSPLAIAEPKVPDFATFDKKLPEKTTFSNKVNTQPGPPEFIPDRYIVVFEDGVSPQKVSKAKGLVPDFVYDHALNGFAGFLSPAELKDLQNDPRVLHIEQDKIAHISTQTLPTGINRIDAEPVSSPSSYADDDITIAILDTGIDYFHIDLNVVKRYQCINIAPFPFVLIDCSEGVTTSDGIALDGHGHGSHVAGIVAALDNDYGPVGVVPGADLWAIKVLEDDGSGSYSQIIMGIDYVIANKNSIDVANMSLGGPKDLLLNQAVANAVAEGIVFVVAAGNEQVDASTRSPASEPSAITVSAYADFDGMPGGFSGDSQSFSSCTEDKDDSFACFSNYGDDIDISAPGVNIFSTYRDGLYHIGSGTSMASPHVAGAAAKLISEGVNPSDVLSTLLANGINSGDPDYLVIDDDPDNISETLLYVGNSNDDPPSPVDNDGDGFDSNVDCDDSNSSIYPGAPELDDGMDNDCDNVVDNGLDLDGDGFTPVFGNDCDDSNSSIYPGAPELDDGIDNDCDNVVDNGLDLDGDGFTPVFGNDCDDSNSSIYPGAIEIPDNGIDEDCDGNDATTGGTPEVHVGDLNWTASNKKNWNAQVTITVHGDTPDHLPVSGVLVQATFTGNEIYPVNCTTDVLGKCQVNKTTKLGSLSFAVLSLDSIDVSDLTNHDPDGDFSDNNPSIIIEKGKNSLGTESDGDGGGGSCNPGQQRKGLC